MQSCIKMNRRKHTIVMACFTLVFFLMPFSAEAVQVKSVNLKKLPGGDVVTIQADAPLTYELFNLTAPPRLVINFPGVSLKKGLEPLHDSHPGVNNVFPIVSSKGLRIKIGMDRMLTYKVREEGDKLIVRFSAVSVGTKKRGAAPAAILKDIDVYDRGPVTELVLRGDHMDTSHDSFMTNRGHTMILDLWGAKSMLPREHYAVATQRIRSVTVGQAAGRVRLVINLVKGKRESHQIDASGQQMTVRFGNIPVGREAPVVRVEDVHFQPDDRIAHLQIRTDVANPIVNISEKKGDVVLDIKHASLATGQQRTQDVSEFPGPIRQVDTYTVDNRVRIVARLREKVNVSSFQQGNVLTLTLTPEDIEVARRGVKGSEKSTYTGQKVTFDFKGIDIQNALKLIAEMSNLNIIMSGDVSGKLTMHLVDVPWDQALDLILQTEGLGKVRQGNVMRIAPLSVLRNENNARLAARKTTESLEPLVTEFISLNYAKVADVKRILAGAKVAGAASLRGKVPSGKGTASVSSGKFGLSSTRGSVLADERTNTLIIRDTQVVINNIKRLIAKIDQPQKQVLIAARIVEATDGFTRDLGVRWGGQVSGHGGRVTNRISNNTTTTTPGVGGFLVDLPAAVGAGAGGQIGLAIGSLNNAFNLNLELSAAETENQIKIISSPRIITMNLKKATISQGEDVPFQSATTANTGPTVIFKKAKLSLEVTPQITAANSLLLHILVTKDSVSKSKVAGGNPILNTKKIETDIFMNNGETIVIGGIYTRDKQNTTNGVPWFSKIPILGWLFKKKFKQDNKTELLIFLTPQILKNRPGRENRITVSG